MDVIVALETIVAVIAVQPSELTFNNSPRMLTGDHFDSFSAV